MGKQHAKDYVSLFIRVNRTAMRKGGGGETCFRIQIGQHYELKAKFRY